MRQWSLTAPTGDGVTQDLVMTAPTEMLLLSYVIASVDFTEGRRIIQDVIVYITNSADTEYFMATHEIRLGNRLVSTERSRAVVQPNYSLVMAAGDKFKIVTSSTNIMCTVKGLIC